MLYPVRRGIQDLAVLGVLPSPKIDHGFVVLQQEVGEEGLSSALVP